VAVRGVPALRRVRQAPLGAERIFAEKRTGVRKQRPELTALLDHARAGDIIAVTELSRLGRTLSGLVELMGTLSARGIHVRSLKENIDTTTPTGRLIFHVMAALAEYERDLTAERAAEGRAAAKRRGETGGRPRIDPSRLDAALALIASGHTVRAAAKAVGVGRATLYRHGIHERAAAA
jgi:DNA invertase Pin-like site-specific DNA recombinase